MKKTFNYISRSGVDVIMILVSLSIATRIYKTNEFAWALLLFYSIYIFAFILRIGQSGDIINDYVIDKDIRKKLNLHPIPGQVYKRKLNLLEKIASILFWTVTITMLILFAIKVI